MEVLSFTDEKAEENFKHSQQVAEILERELQTSNLQHRTSLVPHAPYTISPKTFSLINKASKDKIISIHNQEHPAEDELYKTGGGEYLRFFKIFGIDKSPFPITGKSSIRSVLPCFTNGQTIFLVHNTFMSEEDIIWANEYAAANGLKLVYCICINANLYIENKVPPIDLFIKHNCHIVLGTDSYSSNWQLSIVKEIEAVQKHFPHIPIETILQWATSNGAKALRIESLHYKNTYTSFFTNSDFKFIKPKPSILQPILCPSLLSIINLMFLTLVPTLTEDEDPLILRSLMTVTESPSCKIFPCASLISEFVISSTGLVSLKTHS